MTKGFRNVNKSESWFLILILKETISQILLTLNVHNFSEYGNNVVSVNKAWHNRKTKNSNSVPCFQSSIESQCVFHITTCHVKSGSTSFNHSPIRGEVILYLNVCWITWECKEHLPEQALPGIIKENFMYVSWTPCTFYKKHTSSTGVSWVLAKVAASFLPYLL
jgi:hypothetical protein